MSSAHQIMLFEELSMNAHPALKTQLYDGWILRFSNGYTNRANSVNPIFSSVLPVDEKIAHCENVYGKENLPTVFKLTHELSGALDKVLEKKGYDIVTPTYIMRQEIASVHHQSPDFHISSNVHDDWTNSYFSLNGLADSEKRYTAKQMLHNIQNTVLCGSIVKAGQTVACGLCVIERGFAGLFDIVVDSEYRGRGYGYEVCASLLNEAQKHHAAMAYLQVVQANNAAIGLYSKLGFKYFYEYWYRAKRTP